VLRTAPRHEGVSSGHTLRHPEDPAQRVFGTVAIREGYEVGDDGVRALHPVGCAALLTQAAALEALQAVFPTLKVVGVSSRGLLGSGSAGGGSFHCITQQEPA